eukprot:14793145-Alexandrium_andersonii.AAC.1
MLGWPTGRPTLAPIQATHQALVGFVRRAQRISGGSFHRHLLRITVRKHGLACWCCGGAPR